MHQSSKKDNTKLTVTQLFNYNTNYNPNAIASENIKPNQYNKTYLTELINNLNIDSINIHNTTINKSNQFSIICTTEYAEKKLLYINNI